MKMYEEDINMLEYMKKNTFAHGSGSYIEGISKESMDFVLSRVIDDLKSAGSTILASEIKEETK